MTAAVTSLNASLAQISSELQQCSTRAEQIVAQAAARLWTQPARGGWSVGQCIDHLTRSAEQFIPVVERALTSAAPGGPPYRPTITGRLLKWFIEPPYRMKFKVIPSFAPHQQTSPEQLLREFGAAQQEVQRLLRLAEGKAIDRTIIVSPVDNRAKYDLYSTFRIIAAHERRHLWQAERVLEAV